MNENFAVDKKKKTRKKLIILIVVIALLVVGAVLFFVLNDEGQYPENYEENVTGVYVDEEVDVEEKPVDSYDDRTNEAINKILSIKYTGKDEDFIAYDFYAQPYAEYKALMNCETDYAEVYNPDNFPIDYSWYSGDVVDVEILYNRIKQNTINAGISVAGDCEKMIRLVAEIIPYNIDLLRNKFPDFNFNIPFYNIDKLVILTEDIGDEFYAYYIGSENRVYFNMDMMNQELDSRIKEIVSHELFHMFNNRITEFNDVLIYGSNYDESFSGLDSLCVDFLGELTVDSFALEAMGNPDATDSYVRDNYCLDLLCLSTGKDEFYFKRFAFGMDDAALYNSFEEEVRNINFVYSTTDVIDYACYQKSLENIGVENESTFINDAEIYGCVNIMKNAYIRLIKEINAGNLTYEEARATLDDMNIVASSVFVNISEREEYGMIIEQLDEILEEYCQPV